IGWFINFLVVNNERFIYSYWHKNEHESNQSKFDRY
ncbi:unnamed protein product, partial [marine sediment metagenome]